MCHIKFEKHNEGVIVNDMHTHTYTQSSMSLTSTLLKGVQQILGASPKVTGQGSYMCIFRTIGAVCFVVVSQPEDLPL
jgi:hypothetical protein